MSALDDSVTELIERMLRRPPQRWLARAAMLAFGVAIQLWLGGFTVVGIGAVLAWAVVAAAVVLPRTSLPLIAGVFFLIEAVVTGVTPLGAVPVALGMIGWHLCAVVLTTGRPWARVGSGARRALFWRPALIGVAGIAPAVPSALLASGLVLPELAAVSMLLVLGVVLGAATVLWPVDERVAR